MAPVYNFFDHSNVHLQTYVEVMCNIEDAYSADSASVYMHPCKLISRFSLFCRSDFIRGNGLAASIENNPQSIACCVN